MQKRFNIKTTAKHIISEFFDTKQNQFTLKIG